VTDSNGDEAGEADRAGGRFELDPDDLDDALAAAFDAPAAERRVVVRGAVDLADDGRVRVDRGEPLTVAEIVENLRDAPEGSLPARWNWWLGALEIAYGGYEPFQVRRYRRDGRE
jgi:hypothetical protein